LPYSVGSSRTSSSVTVLHHQRQYFWKAGLFLSIALLSVELYLPSSQSLKDKRMVLRRLKDRLGAFNVAVAEVAHQDVWQRAGLSVVTVASSDTIAEQTLSSVIHEIERLEPDLVTQSQVEFLR
jgi:uncharacterized protein